MQTQKQKVEDQNKKFESKDNITYTMENTEKKNRKCSIGKNGIINRIQNIGEIIEDKVPVEMEICKPRLNKKIMIQWLIKHQITNNKKK